MIRDGIVDKCGSCKGSPCTYYIILEKNDRMALVCEKCARPRSNTLGFRFEPRTEELDNLYLMKSVLDE